MLLSIVAYLVICIFILTSAWYKKQTAANSVALNILAAVGVSILVDAFTTLAPVMATVVAIAILVKFATTKFQQLRASFKAHKAANDDTQPHAATGDATTAPN